MSLLAIATLAAATAAPLPDIDEPLKAGARAPNDAAVVVGIEDYSYIADVPWATRDAQAFYRALVYTVGVPAGRVRLLDQGASHEMIREALGQAATQAGRSGRVWFYFAGHGAASSRDGERMILGQDVRADVSAFDSRGLTMGEISQLAGGQGAQVVMVLDTCYTGRDRAGVALVPGGRFVVPAYASRAEPKVVAWTAAGPNEVAKPLDSVGHGVFTYFVIGALRGWADGQLDGTRDGRVTLEEASLYVNDSLAAAQVGHQHPALQADDAATWVLSASPKLEAPPEIDATTADVRAPAPGPASASYLDALERQAAAEQRLAAERERLAALHREATEKRATQVRSEAHEEWQRVEGIADLGGEAGAEALRTYIQRWDGYGEEIDGVREPIDIPDLDRARVRLRDLARQLSLSGYGLVPPITRDGNRFLDGAGVVYKARDLGPAVASVSEACAHQEAARHRRAISWAMVAGGSAVMIAGFVPFAVDTSTGESLFQANDTARFLGYLGIYGGLGTMSVGYTMAGRWGYDPGTFQQCAQQAAEAGGSGR
ncbi:MAG: caspase family protein [Pseudomonadota bacterium]